MKLWLDDVRPAPEGDWFWAHSVNETKALIDEVECNLIKKEDALILAQKIIKENCNSYPIKELLEYWISYFIRD